MADCPIEQRQVNNNTGNPVSVPVAGGQVCIFTPPGAGGSTCRILEIAMQPENNAHLQLFEGQGGKAMTAIRYVQQYLLWSTPGKIVSNPIYMSIAEANVLVDVDVRFEIL